MQKIKIEKDALVGMGSVVIKNVEESTIVAGVPTSVTVGGASLSERTGTPIVFLHSGTAGCTGAVNALALFNHHGGVPAGGTISVTLSDPGAYKICLAKVASPTLDSDFSFLAGTELEVLPTPATSSPSSSSHTSVNVRDTNSMPALIAGLLGGVACTLLLLAFWAHRRRRHSVLRGEAPLSTIPSVRSQTLSSSGG